MPIVHLYPSKKLQLDYAILIIWMIAGLALTFSLYQQYINQVEPCSLCQWQRFIYVAIFCLAPCGFIECFKITVKMILNLLFLMGLGIALYHTAVQFDWITHQCEAPKIQNAQEFHALFQKSKMQTTHLCTKNAWMLWGWPAVIYNVVLSLFSLSLLNVSWLTSRSQNRRNES